MGKYRPTAADVYRLLDATDHPFGIGDLVYRLVPDGITVSSIKDAEQHVSRSSVEFVLKEMHTNGAVARHTGAEWAEMGISFFDQRPSGTYYALTGKAEEWLQQRAERVERALAKKEADEAHEQATRLLVTRHQDEYLRLFGAFLNSEEPQPEECSEEPEGDGLDELMTITFHGLDELITSDVRLPNHLRMGEHITTGILRAEVIDITTALGDPGPPLVDVLVDSRQFSARQITEHLSGTPGISNIRTGEQECWDKCCPARPSHRHTY